MSLDRFKTAQASAESGITIALTELRAGRKTSHWIWYVFPQLARLGTSEKARFYGLADLAETTAYLADDELRANLLSITAVAAEKLQAGVPLLQLMGSEGDCKKLSSCMTLFAAAASRVTSPALKADCDQLVTSAESILGILAQNHVPPCAVTLAEIGPA